MGIKFAGRVVKVLFLVMVCLAIATPVYAQKPIVWKVHSMWSPALPLHKLFEKYCERVKVMTNGRLEMKPYPADAITPNREALDALKINAIQAMYMFPTIWTGKDPAFAIIGDLVNSFVGVWKEAWELQAFFYQGGGLDLINELYQKFGVTCVGVSFYGGMESMPSRKPVTKLADFKGLKWRAPEGLTAELLTKLGASIVVLPAGEVFTAMDKGLIDGGDLSTVSMNKSWGIYKVAKYTGYPGWHSWPTLDFVVNGKEWEKLPDDLKQIVKTAFREFGMESIELTNLEDLKALQELKAQGVTINAMSEEELGKIQVISHQLGETAAQKNAMSKKIFEAQKDFLRKMGRIK